MRTWESIGIYGPGRQGVLARTGVPGLDQGFHVCGRALFVDFLVEMVIVPIIAIFHHDWVEPALIHIGSQTRQRIQNNQKIISIYSP